MIRNPQNSIIAPGPCSCKDQRSPVPCEHIVISDHPLNDPWLQSLLDLDREENLYIWAYEAIRIAYSDNGCRPIFYFPIAAFTPSFSNQISYSYTDSLGNEQLRTYVNFRAAPIYEYRWNFSEQCRSQFSILGPHYDAQENYIDRTLCDGSFHADLSIKFEYEHVDEVLLGDELIILPFTLYVYRRDADLDFTELFGVVEFDVAPYRYDNKQRVNSCINKVAIRKWAN